MHPFIAARGRKFKVFLNAAQQVQHFFGCPFDRTIIYAIAICNIRYGIKPTRGIKRAQHEWRILIPKIIGEYQIILNQKITIINKAVKAIVELIVFKIYPSLRVKFIARHNAVKLNNAFIAADFAERPPTNECIIGLCRGIYAS